MSAKSNGHNDEPKDDELMKHIIEHLKCKGLRNAAESLQNEIECKTMDKTKDKTKDKRMDKNENTNNDNKNGDDSSRKRVFSEMNGDTNSMLQQFYDNFNENKNKSNINNRNNNNNMITSDEQVMSSQDLSLQSFGEYEQLFSHSNKCSISCISFSSDGLFNCIGCIDGTIRIFDVNKLHQSSNFNSLIKKYDSNSYSDVHRPLISTLNSGGFNYNLSHSQQHKINEIDFYPNLNINQHLTACFNGGLHFFEFNKNHRKTPTITINECFNIRTVQYHPSGEYVIAGGQSCYIRLYDIKKEQGYIAKKNHDNDYNINQIRWSLNGNIFASCTDGGDIRLYDGRSLCVVNTLHSPHRGKSITSIRFSKNCKYLLSSGYDNIIRLFDLRVGKQCMNYRNGGNHACFTYNDEHILSYNPKESNKIFVYDTNTGHRISKFKHHPQSKGDGDNQNIVTYLATSPTESAFMCSTKDNKNRFYATIKRMMEYDDIRNNNNNNNNNIINGHSKNHNDDK